MSLLIVNDKLDSLCIDEVKVSRVYNSRLTHPKLKMTGISENSSPTSEFPDGTIHQKIFTLKCLILEDELKVSKKFLG